MGNGLKILGELGDLMGQRAAANEERLLSFIAVFQRDNEGATPSYSAMANQLGILEEGARALLGRLENKGRVHFISRNPPRIMLTGDGQLPAHEPTPADLANAKPGAASRFLGAEGERMRLARYIGMYERDNGRGPSLREMCDFVGFGTPSYVQRMAEILAEKGVLQYGRGVPTRLTEVGQQLYGIKNGAKKMENKEKKVVVVPMHRAPPANRVKHLCNELAAYKREHGTNAAPNFKKLGVAMGYTPKSNGAITYIVRKAVSAGFIVPRLPRSQAPLQFTEKGLKRFMPEMIVVAPSPAPEVTFTERVPEDSPLRETTTIGERKSLDHLDFDLNSNRLRVNGATKSRAELAAFIGKLGALMPFLGE